MSVQYQALLGDTSIDADAIVTQELDAVVGNIVDLTVTEKAVMNQVSVVSMDVGSTTTNSLKLPTGAALDTVLTCVSLNGSSAWRPPAGVTLAGDAVGAAGGNRVDTLAGGTIAATNLVTLAGTQTVSNKTITLTPLFTCPSTIQTKKIVVYENGVASSTSDHRFSGFGISSYTFRLHCGDSSSDFVFYGPTSATTSNEVFRIKGTGAVSAGGVMTVGGLITPSLTLSTGAASGYILTSNASGVGSWAAPVINNLTGDITSVGLVTTASANMVKTTATQTLTNKTLTLPIISQILNSSATITLPSVTTTLIGTDTSSTLTNKTLTLPIISQILNSSATITLPVVTTTLIGTDTASTLTNKTLKSSTNNIDANTLRFGSTWTADLGGSAPAASNILTYNGTNAVWAAPAAVAAGNLTGDITSVGLATTASASMVKTTAAQTLTNKTFGYTTCNANIYMNNQVANKMIALFDNTTSTDQTAYNFMGFGVATSTLRYQVPGGCAHKFFVNNAASTEVLNVSGSAVSSNVPIIAGVIQAAAFATPTVLGGSLSWNRSGGVAETNFITNTPYGSGGNGQGGWEWATRTTDGVIGRQMYLDGATGNLTVNTISTVPTFFYAKLPNAFDGSVIVTSPVSSNLNLSSPGDYNVLGGWSTVITNNCLFFTEAPESGVQFTLPGFYKLSYRFEVQSTSKDTMYGNVNQMVMNIKCNGSIVPTALTRVRTIGELFILEVTTIVQTTTASVFGRPLMSMANLTDISRNWYMYGGHYMIERMC